jgi:hypothetical protein
LEIELVSCLATLGGIIYHLPPSELGSKDEFQQNDTHALIIIVNCLVNSQVSHISSCNTSKETWDEVFNFFEVHDLMTKMYLMERLTTLKMKENEIMMKHVHNFKSFLNELSVARNPTKDENIVFTLMRSMPLFFYSFLVSIRDQTLTLQTLITYFNTRKKIIGKFGQ